MAWKIVKCGQRIFLYGLLFITACMFPIRVYAADAVTAFGSIGYTAETDGVEFPIGIYIRSEGEIGDYHLELRYDNTRMDYVSGADSEENGLLTLNGTGTGKEVKVFLYFKAVSGGAAGIVFTSAEAYTADGSETLNITEFAYAPVTIDGEDVTGVPFEELLNGLEAGGQNAGREEGEPGMVESGGTGQAAGEPGGTELGTGQEAGEPGGTEPGTGQAAGESGGTELGTGQEPAGSEVAEAAGSLNSMGIGHNVSTAESIYASSRQEVIENNRHRMLWQFLCFVIFSITAVLVAFLIVRIRNAIKRQRQELNGGSNEPDTFLFEFETIPEEKPEESWQQQIREDIDARERAGKNTQILKFRRVNDSEYDLEVNELDYDMEVEYLDMGIEYTDIGQE